MFAEAIVLTGAPLAPAFQTPSTHRQGLLYPLPR
jgi:hypothetical protein